MDLGIAGRTAAVAASSAGLGLGAAQALAGEGVRVALCARDDDRLRDAVSTITAIGGDAIGINADVSSIEGATRFVDAANDALGSIDILVPNAGGPPTGTFASTALDAYAPALELNLLSAVAMCKVVVPQMQSRRWGRVVAITSVSVRQPIAEIILSNTARTGLTGFLKTLALEVASDGVTVNSVQPGSHATDRLRSSFGLDDAAMAAAVQAGRFGTAEDFGAVVAFLCSEQAKFVTGVGLHVDGGSYRGLQ